MELFGVWAALRPRLKRTILYVFALRRNGDIVAQAERSSLWGEADAAAHAQSRGPAMACFYKVKGLIRRLKPSLRRAAADVRVEALSGLKAFAEQRASGSEGKIDGVCVRSKGLVRRLKPGRASGAPQRSRGVFALFGQNGDVVVKPSAAKGGGL